MIVDTSALVAVFRLETDFEALLQALLTEDAALPAPALVEFQRVTATRSNQPHPAARALLDRLAVGRFRIEPFTAADAGLAITANDQFGTGNGRGGMLNLLDLMVYGVAKRTGQAILCTGKDFAATDIPIHPASRSW